MLSKGKIYGGKNKMKRISLVIILICFFSASLIFPGEEKDLEYPALYKDLPRYPNAKLVDTGRQVRSLKDGLRLKLLSPDPVNAITEYYKKEMKKLGWTLPEKKRYQPANIYMGTFTKGKLYFQLRVMRLDAKKQETTIEIAYAEN
jgi:hypothetical protein